MVYSYHLKVMDEHIKKKLLQDVCIWPEKSSKQPKMPILAFWQFYAFLVVFEDFSGFDACKPQKTFPRRVTSFDLKQKNKTYVFRGTQRKNEMSFGVIVSLPTFRAASLTFINGQFSHNVPPVNSYLHKHQHRHQHYLK